MTRPLFVLFGPPVLLAAACATTPARIDRAVNHLVPLTQVQGRTYAPATVEQRMREHGVPAVSVAVIEDGRVAWAKAWGVADVEANRRADANTLFQAASLSKPVTATAALTLVDAGRLSLDEDVNARLRTWKIPPYEHDQKVTLRRLLSHTAGTTVSGFPGYPRADPIPAITQILDGVPPANSAPIRVDTEPGSKFRYSGGGYVILQTLLSDVTGKPFAQLMHEQVLAPARMRASTFEQPIPAAALARTATGYRDDGKPLPGQHHVYPELAAAGLWSTPAELAHWLLALDDLLSPATLAAMFTRQPSSDMGLGIGVGGDAGDPELSHAAANQGFRASFRYYPARRQGVVIMANSESSTAVVGQLLLAFATEYGWRSPKANVIVPIEIAPAALPEFTGTFVPPDRPIELAISSDGGTLFLTISGQTSELVPTAKDVFASVQGGTIRFERDPGGRVMALVFNGRKLQRKE